MTDLHAPAPSSRSRNLRVGLVLGAGGVAGHAFHAGVLRALAEVGGWDARTADLVVGTSAGSIVGTSLRAGLSPSDLYARTVDEPLSPRGAALLRQVPPSGSTPFERRGRLRPLPASPKLLLGLSLQPWRARPGVVMAGLLPEGVVDPDPIARDVDALLDRSAPPPNLWVATVSLSDGRRRVFGQPDHGLPAGSTWGHAVAASCAIPGFFAPVTLGGERFIDGGAHSPTNADLFADRDLDVIVVSSPMSSVRSSGHRSLDAPVRAGYRLRLAAELARLRRRGARVITFQPTASTMRAAGIGAMDPEVRVPVARASYEAAVRRLERTPLPSLGQVDAGVR